MAAACVLQAIRSKLESGSGRKFLRRMERLGGTKEAEDGAGTKKKKKPHRDQYLAYNYLQLPGLLRRRNGDEREGTGRR